MSTQFLPCTILDIHSEDISTIVCDSQDDLPVNVIINLKKQQDLLGVLWFRKLRAHLALYNKSLIAAVHPGIHLEHLKSASIAVLSEVSLQNSGIDNTAVATVTATATATATEQPTPNTTLVHHGHLRGGQSIRHLEGDIVILGNIHHGAEVMAGGHIHVCGALMGRALAGAQLGHLALITAFSLEAELVSIDGYYLSSDEITKSSKPVTIQLDNESIIIK